MCTPVQIVEEINWPLIIRPSSVYRHTAGINYNILWQNWKCSIHDGNTHGHTHTDILGRHFICTAASCLLKARRSTRTNNKQTDGKAKPASLMKLLYRTGWMVAQNTWSVYYITARRRRHRNNMAPTITTMTRSAECSCHSNIAITVVVFHSSFITTHSFSTTLPVKMLRELVSLLIVVHWLCVQY